MVPVLYDGFIWLYLALVTGTGSQFCDKIFATGTICDALKEKLKPALLEIFTGNSDFDYTAIDVSKIV